MDLRKLSVQELVQLCLHSQEEALWAEFVRRFQPVVSGVVVKCLRNRSRLNSTPIDDLVQETYLKLCANNFQALRAFDFQHENALFSFLKVVALNVVEDHFRSSHSQKRGSGQEMEDLDETHAARMPSDGASDRVELGILMGEVQRCLETLASEPNFARDHDIFWLYYRQGLTAKAISELPGIQLSVKGVESTLLRLTRLVRAKLAGVLQKKRAISG